jgi:hypothetical protein
MNAERILATTSISIPQDLLDRGKVHAHASYRTFSQYVSYLVDQDLKRADKRLDRHHATLSEAPRMHQLPILKNQAART